MPWGETTPRRKLSGGPWRPGRKGWVWGWEADIPPYLPANRDGLRLVLAPEVIGSHEPPVEALRLKPGSSIRVGLELVKKGEAQAFVSAGSTGAVAAAAMPRLGTTPG